MKVGEVRLVDYMGSDLSVVNAARVSFRKHKEILDERDVRLIRYLAQHRHWTPFGHTALTFHVKAPLFVARQLAKHQVGFVWNEVSRRYVDDRPEFFVPICWRRRAANKKQGSSDEPVEKVVARSRGNGRAFVERPEEVVRRYCEQALGLYEDLIGSGVCPEQARMVLPQNMMTEWYWTGSLAAFARMCRLRLDEHAQWETRQIAQKISDTIPEAFKYSWAALMEAGE